MNLCRVTGDVVSTVKNGKFVGHRILCVQPVELDCRTPRGSSFLAIDLVQAGVGDLVLTITEGGGVRIHFGDDKIPLSSVITSHVDELDVVADESSLVGVSALEQTLAADARGETWSPEA
jgi:microcompartment protein CcmK/EutM